MKVRFILPWQFYRKGAIIEPPGLLRGWLIARGYVEEVKEKPAGEEPEVETAAVEPAAHKAVRKRGRPRKVGTVGVKRR